MRKSIHCHRSAPPTRLLPGGMGAAVWLATAAAQQKKSLSMMPMRNQPAAARGNQQLATRSCTVANASTVLASSRLLAKDFGTKRKSKVEEVPRSGDGTVFRHLLLIDLRTINRYCFECSNLLQFPISNFWNNFRNVQTKFTRNGQCPMTRNDEMGEANRRYCIIVK
jgi:hypothetical protein